MTNRVNCTNFQINYRVLPAPKKSFGQNFLVNDVVCQRIVGQFLELNKEKNVLEVGPGKGALTKYLLREKKINFRAVEADWSMADHLESFYAMGDKLIQKDFLKLNFNEVFDGESFSVIGNFPYNISSQILFKVEKHKEMVPTVVGMFQKELAERIVSKEGTKKYGVISVLLQTAYEPKLLFNVGPESFYPAPKVTSTIISLERKKDFTLPCNRSTFRSVVKLSFNQRRKMIRNSIKSLVKDNIILDSEYMTRRPEQMSLQDYYDLTRIIENQ